jgi:hypothetical protein
VRSASDPVHRGGGIVCGRAVGEIVLAGDNVFGLPEGTEGLSVAHGWAALLNPWTPGSHQIVIASGSQTITVTPGG